MTVENIEPGKPKDKHEHVFRTARAHICQAAVCYARDRGEVFSFHVHNNAVRTIEQRERPAFNAVLTSKRR